MSFPPFNPGYASPDDFAAFILGGAYVMGGTLDPTVSPGVDARKGAVWIQVGQYGAGNTGIWQKQDDGLSTNWTPVFTPDGGVTGVGVFDSEPKSVNGAVIVGTDIIFQSGDEDFPGMITNLAQIIAGEKTFLDAFVGQEVATPANPDPGFMKLYFKTDEKLYSLDSAGNEVEIGSNFPPQAAHTVFAGPTSGAPADPAFRALVGSDIPVDPAGPITNEDVGLNISIGQGLALETTSETPPETILLLHADNNFDDANTPAKIAFQPAYVAGEFDQAIDFAEKYNVSYPSDVDSSFDFGTGDFTIEFWIKPSDFVTDQHFFNRWLWAGGDWYLILLSNVTSLRFGVNGIGNCDSALSINDGQFHHIAIVRDGATITAYIDGVADGTLAIGASPMPFTASIPLCIGSVNDRFQNRYDGAIDDLRIQKGVAVYTSNFTPPAAPLTSDADTAILLNFDDNIDDASTYGHQALAVEYIPGEFDQAFSFNNSVGIRFESVADFDFGLNDFTIDFWIKPTDFVTNNQVIMSRWVNAGTGDWRIIAINNFTIVRFEVFGEALIDIPVSINDGDWHQISINRSQATGELFTFVDGVLATQSGYANSIPFDPTTDFTLNGISDRMEGGFYEGGLDEVRLINGVAANIVAFTPPTAPYGTGQVTLIATGMYTPVFQRIVLDAGQIAAKEVALSSVPSTASIITQVVGMGPIEYGVDIEWNGSALSWDGLGLDGFLVVNDVILVNYSAV